ncbi:phage head morphogenesis protein [Acinetobacter pittii]|uniref:minor capsid protein n=1 Tax=Acinetobacter pittii TaxID=48296 RepID=UPI000B399851|nr:minor capsid protein [Acinetobacter pittii]MCH2052198.1 minor capsid protein [Acinetobacter pittii]RSO16466.1 phage head morphogenesis protein [Acinetobacter pittii]
MVNLHQKSLFDVLTQHQAYLYRASSRSVNELLNLFNSETVNMLTKLSNLLDELNEKEKTALAGGLYSTATLKGIRALISQWFNTTNNMLIETFTISAVALAVYEAKYMSKVFGGKHKELKGEQLYKAAKRVPLAGGALVDELLSTIAEVARQRVEYAIRNGLNTGETNQQIIQRILGTERLKYEDGLLNSSKIDIERTVRTIRSHISNQAYLNSYKQLKFEYVRFVSVLDGRTSKVCAALDSSVWNINDPTKKVPPLHPHCRSILVPTHEDGQLVGSRAFIMDERKFRDIPKNEREQLIGQLDANMSFKEFFKLTDDFFQKEWLGPKRYQLYKEGQFDFDKFFDPEGRLYTLEELKELDERAFKVLGL